MAFKINYDDGKDRDNIDLNYLSKRPFSYSFETKKNFADEVKKDVNELTKLANDSKLTPEEFKPLRAHLLSAINDILETKYDSLIDCINDLTKMERDYNESLDEYKKASVIDQNDHIAPSGDKQKQRNTKANAENKDEPDDEADEPDVIEDRSYDTV